MSGKGQMMPFCAMCQDLEKENIALKQRIKELQDEAFQLAHDSSCDLCDRDNLLNENNKLKQQVVVVWHDVKKEGMPPLNNWYLWADKDNEVFLLDAIGDDQNGGEYLDEMIAWAELPKYNK